MIGSEGALGRDHRGLDAAAGPRRASAPTPCSASPTSSRPPGPCARSRQAGLYPSNLRVIDNNEAGDTASTTTAQPARAGFESADHPVDAWMARALELARDHGGRRLPDEGAAQAGARRSSACPMRASSPCRSGSSTTHSRPRSPGTGSRRSTPPCASATAAGAQGGDRPGRSWSRRRFTHVYPDGPAPYYTFNARGAPAAARAMAAYQDARLRRADRGAAARSPTITRSGATTCPGTAPAPGPVRHRAGSGQAAPSTRPGS